MQFFNAWALVPALLSVTSAFPLIDLTVSTASGESKAAPAADVPGVVKLTNVSRQLGAVITEIKTFKGNNLNDAQSIVTHAADVVRSLDDAVNVIRDSPDIDLWTATSYAKVAIPLTTQVKDLNAALKDAKPDIVKLGLGRPTFQILDSGYAELVRLTGIYTTKCPAILKPILKPWLSDISETLGEVKEFYRDVSGDASSFQLQQQPPQGNPSTQFQGGYVPASYSSEGNDAGLLPYNAVLAGNPAIPTSTIIVYLPAPTPGQAPYNFGAAQGLPVQAWQPPFLPTSS